MEQFVADILDFVVEIDERTVSLILDLRGPIATKVLTSVTGLGSASAAVVFLGVFYLAGWKEELLTAAVALALTGVVVGVLMRTVQRPFPPDPVCMTGDAENVATSFPSGHAAAVVVFAMIARQSPRLPFGVVAGLAAMIAFSRVYLGTHYLSDTVAGVAIGIGAFVVAERLVDRWDLASRLRPYLD
jgi:undecaprenyl-diphosphatase